MRVELLACDNFIDRPYGSFRIFPDTPARRCAMPETPVRSSKLLLAGLFAAASGAMILALASGVVPSKGAHAPVWIGVCAGLLFLLAGGALVLRWFAGGSADD